MSFSISCDDCTMRCSTACDDCVVTFVLRTEEALDRGLDRAVDPSADQHSDRRLDLDADQQRVVHLMTRAGLVPKLMYRVAS